MDGAVEASVEALACRYAAALAAPLLAWLAVAAAALGLWRIRAVASKSDARPPPPPPPPPFVDPRASRAAPPGERSPRCHVEWDGTRRGRFTAYFHVEDNSDEEEEEEEGEGEGEGEGKGEDKGVSEVDGETLLSGRRRGDPHHLGWYRYQDRTALSGNVVRLWGVRKVSDGRITATSSSVGRVITATGGVKREIHENLF